LLRIPDPVPFWPLDQGWVKIRSGSGMNIADHISESLETIFWVKSTGTWILWCGSGIRSLFNPDPRSGMEKNSDPGSGINIPGGSVTLVPFVWYYGIYQNICSCFFVCLHYRYWYQCFEIGVPELIHWIRIRIQAVAESGSRSRPIFLWQSLLIYVSTFFSENRHICIPKFLQRTFSLQEKYETLNFHHFFLILGDNFGRLDPHPDPMTQLNLDPIRTLNTSLILLMLGTQVFFHFQDSNIPCLPEGPACGQWQLQSHPHVGLWQSGKQNVTSISFF
jgi:hypothetical protein